MRIGIDMYGLEDAGVQNRGIGRTARHFVAQLAAADSADAYLFYFHEGLFCAEKDRFPASDRRMIGKSRSGFGEQTQRLVDANPDGLDWFLVTNPFSGDQGHAPPAAPCRAPSLASMLYDLIPMIEHDVYLAGGPGQRRDYYERIERLRQYDALLTVSAATKADAVSRLGIPARRVIDVSQATLPDFFTPSKEPTAPAGLSRLGIEKPFVFTVAGMDPRKNTEGLLRAFALMPHSLRAEHQLVVSCALSPYYLSLYCELTAELGIRDRVVFTGAIADELLRAGYQHCAAFVFASHYEGFGMPILEALHCGAPVLASANSAQPEVLGDAGLLVDASDPQAMADQLTRLLSDAALSARLRRRGPRQAAKFSWFRTAARTRAAFRTLLPRTRPKSLCAFFGALPSQRTHAANFFDQQIEALADDYSVHLYYGGGDHPAASLRRNDRPAFDYGAFAMQNKVLAYDVAFLAVGARPADSRLFKSLAGFSGVGVLSVSAGGISDQRRILEDVHRFRRAAPFAELRIVVCDDALADGLRPLLADCAVVLHRPPPEAVGRAARHLAQICRKSIPKNGLNAAAA